MATKKTKAKAKTVRSSSSTTTRVRRTTAAANSAYTSFEANGIVIFSILAIIFFLIAVVKNM